MGTAPSPGSHSPRGFKLSLDWLVGWNLLYWHKLAMLVYLFILTFIQEYLQVKLAVMFLGQRIHVFKIAKILAQVAF